jgi:hypothetical protein
LQPGQRAIEGLLHDGVRRCAELGGSTDAGVPVRSSTWIQMLQVTPFSSDEPGDSKPTRMLAYASRCRSVCRRSAIDDLLPGPNSMYWPNGRATVSGITTR